MQCTQDSIHLTSDTRLVFLSGEHSLNIMWIGNITNLAMIGSEVLTPAPEHMDLPQGPQVMSNFLLILLDNNGFVFQTTISCCGITICNFSALAMLNITNLSSL